MINFVYDYTGDGWPDVLVTESRPLVLYVNPRGEPRRWDRFLVLPGVSSETVVFKDVDGDGRPDPVYIGGGTVNYATPDPSDATKPWIVHTVSGTGFTVVAQHGVGVGDINGEARTSSRRTAGGNNQRSAIPVRGPTIRWRSAVGCVPAAVPAAVRFCL